MISVRHKGDFSKTINYLGKVKKAVNVSDLDRFGREGVAALASATPYNTGLAASSWYHEIQIQNGRIVINFCNSDIENGVPVAIILQYGHGTRNGGWVEGRDYINPAIQPIFDRITEQAWREVTRL